MNLIIDVGNTLIKLAVFKQHTLVFFQKANYTDVSEKIQKIKIDHPNIKHVILSSVSKLKKEAIEEALGGLKTIVLSHKTPIPFTNLYQTPETLGVDRLALVAGAYYSYPNKNCLIIDVGTCITYDFLNSEGDYLGGGIGPGLQMRYKSLNDHTANLPLLTPINPNYLIGDTTQKAIHVGIYNGFISEISGIIEQFSNSYPHLVVILTGGDADFLSERLKNGIFANPIFLLQGLNYILEYNHSK